MAENCVQSIVDAEFDTQVLNHPGPVLVDFYTPTCPPCQMLAPVLEQFCQDRCGSVKIVKVDASDSFNTAVRYGLQVVPTLILFRGGQPIGQRTGYLSQPQLQQWIDAILAA